jgi:hypothetical protein
VNYHGDSYILRADIPVGIGGFQVLAMTRANIGHSSAITRGDLGYGVKYNFANRWVDIDMGTFYQERMAWRNFVSIKTTIGHTELYNEWMSAINFQSRDLNNEWHWLNANEIFRFNNMSGAVNLGFAQNFFDDKLTVNGELFFNSERGALYYSPETNLREAEVSPFPEGFNLAVGLLYRFGGRGNPRVFFQTLYAPTQDSARVVTGLRLSPWPHIDFSLAIPMSLGSKNGPYYPNTLDPNNRPLSILLMLSLHGGVRIAHFN